MTFKDIESRGIIHIRHYEHKTSQKSIKILEAEKIY